MEPEDREEIREWPCLVTGDWCKTFEITVTNTGPGDYNDKIVVEENIPPGMRFS